LADKLRFYWAALQYVVEVVKRTEAKRD
jgi:hypothetical protein